jgi:hypothetical protein
VRSSRPAGGSLGDRQKQRGGKGRDEEESKGNLQELEVEIQINIDHVQPTWLEVKDGAEEHKLFNRLNLSQRTPFMAPVQLALNEPGCCG